MIIIFLLQNHQPRWVAFKGQSNDKTQALQKTPNALPRSARPSTESTNSEKSANILGHFRWFFFLGNLRSLRETLDRERKFWKVRIQWLSGVNISGRLLFENVKFWRFVWRFVRSSTESRNSQKWAFLGFIWCYFMPRSGRSARSSTGAEILKNKKGTLYGFSWVNVLRHLLLRISAQGQKRCRVWPWRTRDMAYKQAQKGEKWSLHLAAVAQSDLGR